MFLIDIMRALNALIAIQTATVENIAAGGSSAAKEMEGYAKVNAPWHDRTGNARRTLEGFCADEFDCVTIGICGNMVYSPRLELGFHGRYAILSPTLEFFSPVLIDMIRNAVVAAAASSGGASGE